VRPGVAGTGVTTGIRRGSRMWPQHRCVETASCDARAIYMVVSLSLFFLVFEANAATSVPHQLRGKSVLMSATNQQTYLVEATGKFLTLHFETSFTFYFSSQGRIFVRRLVRDQFGDSRTYEQVGSDPNRVQRPTLATGTGKGSGGTGAESFQDIHFEGQTLIAIQRVGENGADRIAIEFDQNFATCAPRGVLRGTDNGRPVRIIGWDGRVLRRISGQSTSRPSCVVRDGNTFGQ